MCVEHERHKLIPYALEAVPRPGDRETRVRRPPDVAIRNERSDAGEREG